MNIIIFGTGVYGTMFKRYCEISKAYDVVAAVDNCCRAGETLEWRNVKLVNPNNIGQFDFDKVFITVKKLRIAKEMKNQLIELGISENNIVCIFESEELISSVLAFSYYDESDLRVNWMKAYAKFVEDQKMGGNVAECGVNRGDFSMYINQFFANKKLYMFDTFEGFSKTDVEIEREIADLDFLKGSFNQVGHFNDTNADLVLNRMPHKEQCVIKKGYFPDTAVGLENETFCFVNLDMDLYKPQLEGLRFFYDRMVSGGVILLHDYYHKELPGVKVAVDEFLSERENEHISLFPIGDHYSIAIIKS